MIRRNSKNILTSILLVISLTFLLTGWVYSQDTGKAKENFNLGLAEEQKGNTEMAVKFYEAAIASDAGFADAYLNLGSIYFNQKNYGEAANNFKKVTELDPNNADGFTNYGKVLTWIKRMKQLWRHFKTL